MRIAAPSKLGQWVIYCIYKDENDTMDTVPDFLTPAYKIVFPKTKNCKVHKTFPIDTEDVLLVACCCHSANQVAHFINQRGNWWEMEVKVQKGESTRSRYHISILN